MTNIELKYNPFAVKTDFYIDGKETSLECFGTGKDVHLREYINDFFPAAIKKSNLGPGSDCVIQFYGTKDAFEDVKAAYQKYSGQFEGIKIELPEYKPYPNNFSEINILIEKKRKQFSDQIAFKKEELINPSAGKSNVELSDVIKRFDRDKAKIERTYSDCLDETKAVIEKAKEGVDFVSSADNEITHFLNIENAKAEDLLPYANAIGLLRSEGVKVYYDKIKEHYNLAFTKTCEELTDLLRALFEKLDTALYSGFETAYKDYTAVYPGFLAFNQPLQKFKQSNSFGIKKTIPDSFFGSIGINEASSNVKIGIALINEKVEKAASSCCEYFDSVFESTKKDFFLETEKCKTYYLEELTELEETIKEKLTSTKHIEQEITVLENKIECLDELQSEITKLSSN